MTHSVPILREGKPAGVAGVDLSRDYFRVIRQWLDELDLHRAYCFVLGDDDEFIIHPDRRYQALKGIRDLPGMAGLKALIQTRKTGFVEEMDPRSGRHSRFCVAPVSCAKWTVVIALPKSP